MMAPASDGTLGPSISTTSLSNTVLQLTRDREAANSTKASTNLCWDTDIKVALICDVCPISTVDETQGGVYISL